MKRLGGAALIVAALGLWLSDFGAATAGLAATDGVVRGGGRAAPAHRSPHRIARVHRVIDGDTFVIQGGARVRVRNFDTPERRRYRCADEKRAAEAATKAARGLLTRRRVALTISGEDRYGRLVADVRIISPTREEDFVERMVSSGHGARWDYGREPRPDWCPNETWWSALFF